MDYIHSEFGIYLRDFMPTQGNVLHGINNYQAFIAVNNFGMNKYEIEKRADKQAPSDTR